MVINEKWISIKYLYPLYRQTVKSVKAIDQLSNKRDSNVLVKLIDISFLCTWPTRMCAVNFQSFSFIGSNG